MRIGLILGLLAAWACGPIDQSGGPGSTGSPADGGTTGGSGTDAGTGTGGGSGAVLDCTGVLPGDPSSPVTVTTPHGGGDVCWNATGDLAGNVAAESHASSMGEKWTGRWQVWSTTGAERGSFNGAGGDLFGQQQGFLTTQGNAVVFWAPDGTAARRTALGNGCSAQAFDAGGTGALVLVRCGSKLTAHRFDAQGARAASAALGDVSSAAGVIDVLGRTLIVTGQGGAVSARWYDANLGPASDAFAIDARGSSSQPILRQLVGGGAAIQVDGAWVATVRSGNAGADSAPEWLSSHANFDLAIVRQQRAYALVPRAGASPHDTLDLYSGAGERCGSVKLPVDGLSLSPDGTVIGSSGDGGCTHSFWTGLLR